jgi:hypothetical protein
MLEGHQYLAGRRHCMAMRSRGIPKQNARLGAKGLAESALGHGYFSRQRSQANSQFTTGVSQCALVTFGTGNPSESHPSSTRVRRSHRLGAASVSAVPEQADARASTAPFGSE